jgi:hypothetical protein
MTAMRDDELDDLLALAARSRPDARPALLDRVLADALAAQPITPPAARATHRDGWFSRLAGAFGGVTALAAVCSSVVLGLAVGYLHPAAVEALTGGLTGVETEALDLFPTTDFLTVEG